MKLKFTGADITKIVKSIQNGNKWEYTATSNNGKLTWLLKNNKNKSKIDLLVNGKFIDDWAYYKSEKNDVYATVVNVLDYLIDVVAKYNRINKAAKVVKEDSDETDLDGPKIKVRRALKMKTAVTEVTEAMSKGMLRAYSKRVSDTDTHYCCKDCGQKIPKYSGRYGKNCPNCGGNIIQMKEIDREDAVSAAFQRGQIIQVNLPDGPDKFWTAKGKILGFKQDTKEYSVEVTEGPDKGKLLNDLKLSQISDIT